MKPSELLSSKEKWIKGDWARTEAGIKTTPSNKAASCWCLVGAIKRCQPFINISYIEDQLKPALQKFYPQFVNYAIEFNDDPSTTYEDVIKVLKEAGL